MPPRPVMIATLLGATVGVPYLASNSQKAGVSPAPPPATSHGTPTYASGPGGVSFPTTPPAGSGPAVLPVAVTPAAGQIPVTPVAQVLRFDVSRQWVDSTWPRRVVAPTEAGLTSVRVPLVSGLQLSSLAGSLTYYFNAYGQVEHITVHGRTGDAGPLIQLLMRQYRFQRTDSGVGEQVYQVRNEDVLYSELRVQDHGVAHSNTPRQNVQIHLELARPGTTRYLPERRPALHVPPDPASDASAQAASAAEKGNSIKKAAGDYWDRVRFATPEEKAPAAWTRWPD